MKKFYYLPLALAALTFTGCSDDTVAPSNGDKTNVLAEGGYIKVGINLPSTVATKATTDGSATFDDGTANEYNVKSAALLLFSGAQESDAEFIGAYDLGSKFTEVTPYSDQITKVVKVAATDEATRGDKLYALVVLNYNSLLTIGSTAYDKAPAYGCAIKTKSNQNDSIARKYTPTSGTAQTGTKITDLGQKIIELASGDTDPHFVNYSNGALSSIVMVNAPLSKNPGQSADPTSDNTYTTLAAIDASKVFTTEEEALANPAAEVFVERAVAKVTMHKTTNTTLSGSAVTTLKASTLAWQLDITNKKSYFIHQLNNSASSWDQYKSDIPQSGATYRMIGSSEVKSGYGYRYYWGTDPNYSGKTTSSEASYATGRTTCEFDTLSDVSAVKGTFVTSEDASAGAQYCAENTFNVANMNQNQTTRAIVKVGLSGNVITYASSAYSSKVNTSAGDSKTFYYVPNQVKSITVSSTATNMACYDAAGFCQLVQDVVKSLLPNCTTSVDSTKNLTVDEKTGVVTFHGDKDNRFFSGLTEKDSIQLTKAINEQLGTVKKYANGICYYPIRIRHFSDTNETPWTAEKHTPSTIYTAEVSGGDAEKEFLGRYGVLRNNWYDITVNSIKKIGEPTIPEIPNTPDDEVENYISFSINILSWAKRTQQADL